MSRSDLSELHYLAVVCACCLGVARSANLFSVSDSTNVHVWIGRHGKAVAKAIGEGRRIDPYGSFVVLEELLTEKMFARALRVVEARNKGNKRPSLPSRKYTEKNLIDDFRLYVLPRMMGRAPTYYDILRRMRLASYDLNEGLDLVTGAEALPEEEAARAASLIKQRLQMNSDQIHRVMDSYKDLEQNLTPQQIRKFDLSNTDFLNKVARKDAGVLSPEEFWMVHESRIDKARAALGYDARQDPYSREEAIKGVAEDVSRARAILTKHTPEHADVIGKMGTNHIEGKAFGSNPKEEMRKRFRKPPKPKLKPLDGSAAKAVLGDQSSQRGPTAKEVAARRRAILQGGRGAIPGTKVRPGDPIDRGPDEALAAQAAMVQSQDPHQSGRVVTPESLPPVKSTRKRSRASPPPPPRKEQGDLSVPLVIDTDVDLFGHPANLLQDSSHFGNKPWNRVEHIYDEALEQHFPPEPMVWFTCFEIYRTSGVLRQVQEAWSIFRAKNNHAILRKISLDDVKDIAALWRWQERAEAWDLYRVHMDRIDFEEERKKAIVNQVNQMKMFDAILSSAMGDVIKKYTDKDKNNPEVTFNELARMFQIGSKVKDDMYNQFGEDVHRTPLRLPSFKLSGDLNTGLEGYTSTHMDELAQILGELDILPFLIPEDTQRRLLMESQARHADEEQEQEEDVDHAPPEPTLSPQEEEDGVSHEANAEV